ncbi:MAG: VTC domain-containing protein, partial [Eubacteriales bacterium]
MAAQTVFKRYELKYMLTNQQYQLLHVAMENHMELDQFGRHTIHNVYYDTADYLLIRHSLEKPEYKEKLR